MKQWNPLTSSRMLQCPGTGAGQTYQSWILTSCIPQNLLQFKGFNRNVSKLHHGVIGMGFRQQFSAILTPSKQASTHQKKPKTRPHFCLEPGGSPGSPSIPPKRPWSQCHVVEAWDGRCMDLDLPLGLPGDSASWWRVFQWTPWTPLGLGPMGVDVVW